MEEGLHPTPESEGGHPSFLSASYPPTCDQEMRLCPEDTHSTSGGMGAVWEEERGR